ncbi:MAG: hypothetical protein IJZ62_05790 [Clostridia bacterium]|nr:hypothetical protein [Clostridia bacterium]
MKKKWLLVLTLCFVAICCLCLPACSLGGYTVTFINYDGNVVGTRTYSSDESVTNANSPSVPGRIGYTFVRWDYDGDPSTTTETRIDDANEFNMYAIYQINPNDTYFNQSGRKIQWYGGNTSTTIALSAGQETLILFQDLIGYKNISKLEATSDSGSFTLEVCDKYGQLVDMNSYFVNVWVPSSQQMPTLGEYNYMLRLVSDYDLTLTINITE